MSKITDVKDIPLDQNGMPILDNPIGEEEIRQLYTLAKESDSDVDSQENEQYRAYLDTLARPLNPAPLE